LVHIEGVDKSASVIRVGAVGTAAANNGAPNVRSVVAESLCGCRGRRTDIASGRTIRVRSLTIRPAYTGGDRFRPDGYGGGGMPRTLDWPG